MPASETIDLYGAADFLPHMPTVRGRTALLHRLARRLRTRRGRIPWWPDFGTDLRDFLLAKSPATRIAAAAVAECRKDEQVAGAYALNLSTGSDGKTVFLTLGIEDGEGPFRFTLSITEAALTLVSAQEV
jgi:hypothetical protein